MEDSSVLHLTGSVIKPALVSEVGKWYAETHIPMLMEFEPLKEVKLCQRLYDKAEYPTYVVMYKFDHPGAFQAYESSPELAAAHKDRLQQWPGNAFDVKWRVQYEVIRSWKR
ncbi:MAG: hypothetical protein HW402_765 [Dehalococcoidales bacterium]|nr:hypothetical protein [Dehalococcoidales bacterium]